MKLDKKWVKAAETAYDSFPEFPFLNEVNRPRCVEVIARSIQGAVEEEREACGNIAWHTTRDMTGFTHQAEKVREAIRQRSKQEAV